MKITAIAGAVLGITFFFWLQLAFPTGAKIKAQSGCSNLIGIGPAGTPGKRIFFTPPEGGHYAALWLADVGANTDDPGILGARLDQIVVFGAVITLGPDGRLKTSPLPPENAFQIPPAQVVVPSAEWRLPTEFECSELE